MYAKKALQLLATGFIVAGVLFVWRQGTARRESLSVLNQLEAGLAESNSDTLHQSMVMPAALQGRSMPEQTQFLRKALLDELSPEGLAALKKHGRFGILTKIFPDEAEAWANQAGVAPDNCVAFRMERNGHRAEVVLVETAGSSPNTESYYRIVRVNNVRQMADAHP